MEKDNDSPQVNYIMTNSYHETGIIQETFEYQVLTTLMINVIIDPVTEGMNMVHLLLRVLLVILLSGIQNTRKHFSARPLRRRYRS